MKFLDADEDDWMDADDNGEKDLLKNLINHFHQSNHLHQRPYSLLYLTSYLYM